MTEADPFLVVYCPQCDARHQVSGVEVAQYDAERARITDGFAEIGCPVCVPESWGRGPSPAPPTRVTQRPPRMRSVVCLGSYVASSLLAATQEIGKA